MSESVRTVACGSASPDVVVEVHKDLMTIAINRPSVRNALNTEVLTAIVAAFAELDADPGVRAAILTGTGGYFSAGMDLAKFTEGAELDLTAMRAGRPRKPVIAAIEGFALAGGLELALACDLIVASATARLGIPEVKRGIYAAAGGLLRLPRRIPHHVAMEMALTGDPIDGARGFEHGLVNRVCESGDALATATELAHRITANSPAAVRVSKELVLAGSDVDEGEGWARSESLFGEIFFSDDAKEGTHAFLEKRDPAWSS